MDYKVTLNGAVGPDYANTRNWTATIVPEVFCDVLTISIHVSYAGDDMEACGWWAWTLLHSGDGFWSDYERFVVSSMRIRGIQVHCQTSPHTRWTETLRAVCDYIGTLMGKPATTPQDLAAALLTLIAEHEATLSPAPLMLQDA